MSDPILIPARTAWGEARGEGARGMQAVLNVIGNRANNPGWWGRDFVSVCLMQSRGIHQFSCWNARDPNAAKINAVTASDPDLAAAILLARQLAAGTLVDITGGADSYYARGSQRPAWATSDRMTCSIGHHTFFRVGLDGHGGGVTTDELNAAQVAKGGNVG
jgi:spore germination cell wall hydrolase CwlJ-like protein